MLRKLRLPLAILAVLALASAAYLGVSLILSPSANRPAALPGQVVNFELIPAPELPQTQSDFLGSVVEVRNNSLMLRPLVKGSSSQNVALVELVISAGTKVYGDTTSDRTGTISAGRLQQTVAPFEARNIAPADTVVAWGQRRGDRLLAEVILIQRNS